MWDISTGNWRRSFSSTSSKPGKSGNIFLPGSFEKLTHGVEALYSFDEASGQGRRSNCCRLKPKTKSKQRKLKSVNEICLSQEKFSHLWDNHLGKLSHPRLDLDCHLYPESLFSICLLCLEKLTLEWATSIFLIQIIQIIFYLFRSWHLLPFPVERGLDVIPDVVLPQLLLPGTQQTGKTCSFSMSSFQNFKSIHKLKNNQY